VQVSAGGAGSWRGRRIGNVIAWRERSLLNEGNQLAFGAKETGRAVNGFSFFSELSYPS